MHQTGMVVVEPTARRMEGRSSIIPRFPAASSTSELMRVDWTRVVREETLANHQQPRSDSVIAIRRCLTGTSHDLTGHRRSPGGEPIPFVNGDPVGQDKFLLPLRTHRVTSTWARHRTSGPARHRQSVDGCLEQLVPGTSGARVRLTRTLRNLPAASVSNLQQSIRTRESQEVPQPGE